MGIELDHFFILTDSAAPGAKLLTNIGMTEGTANDHPGQGTSNRRFFFADSMLELLYVRDAREATNGPGHRLHLAERLADETASPFGLVFRASDDSTSTPFSGWRYYPEYLDADQYFYVGENSDHIEEPLCIYLPATFSQAKKSSKTGRFDRVTEVRICFPSRRASPVLESIGECQGLSLVSAEPHLMEITFNGSKERQSRDLRPSLPLIVRW
jgi:hypothetical protein